MSAKIAMILLVVGSTSIGRAATLEYIGQGLALTDLSADGAVAVGNVVGDGSYETWRWVRDDELGWQRLGAPTVPQLGTGSGTPDVSYDGTRVSATILGETGTYMTWGIWTLGQSWQELIPPTAPDGILSDSSYASAWGLSGDGDTLTGFYWGLAGKAKPSKWTEGVGIVALDLPIVGKNARVNASSFDGFVTAGWSEGVTGAWRATAWRGTDATVLQPEAQISIMVNAVNADGTILVGKYDNQQALRRDAARWDWNGTSYDLTPLGVLPGTPQTDIGHVWAASVTDDGSIITGTNRFFENGPFSVQTGFVWTEAEGMRDIIDVMADLGLSFPDENWIVVNLHVSPDGSTLGGMVLDTNQTTFLDYWSFVIDLTPAPTCAGDVNGDGATDVFDFADLSANFGAGPGATREQGDLNGDGYVDVFDFGDLAADFGCDIVLD